MTKAEVQLVWAMLSSVDASAQLIDKAIAAEDYHAARKGAQNVRERIDALQQALTGAYLDNE